METIELVKVSHVLCAMYNSVKSKVISKAVDFFMKYGVKNVSMDEISRNLGISKKTLYNVIDSKEELLKLALLHHLDEEKSFVNEARSNSSDAVEEMVTISKFIIEILRQHNPALIFEVRKNYPEVWELIEDFNQGFVHQFVFDNILRGQKEGLYRTDMDPNVISRLYVSRISVMVDNDLFPVMEFPRAELYNQFITHHMMGMMSSKGISRFNQISEI